MSSEELTAYPRSVIRMTPWDFYHDFVWSNFLDFQENRGSLRRAFNAAIAAFQMADQFYFYFKRFDTQTIASWPKKDQFLQHLRTIEPAFGTIQTVANVYKHLYLTQPHYDADSPAALRAISGSGVLFGEPDVDADCPEVILKRKNGSTIVFYDSLKSVVEDMWPKVLPDFPA